VTNTGKAKGELTKGPGVSYTLIHVVEVLRSRFVRPHRSRVPSHLVPRVRSDLTDHNGVQSGFWKRGLFSCTMGPGTKAGNFPSGSGCVLQRAYEEILTEPIDVIHGDAMVHRLETVRRKTGSLWGGRTGMNAI